MNPRVADGYYAVWDVGGAGRITYWRVSDRGRDLSAWPVNAKYGPLKPPYDPNIDPEVRRAATRRWRDERDAYLRLTLEAIAADPTTATHVFVRRTGRCRSCKAELTPDDLQPLPDAMDAPQTLEVDGHSPAHLLLDAALTGRVVDARLALGDADPAEVIARLADAIGALAPLTGLRAGR